ncbi:MAG: hypothetical protein Q4D80_04900 [Pseudomonadota bacterium]|nr:hypothetical protein [Pseudomonadota bacterium]
MKTAVWTGIFMAGCVCATQAQTQDLPVNPWSGQNQTVRISHSDGKSSNRTGSAQVSEMERWAAHRAEQVRQNNARIRKENIARLRAEQERLRQEAKARAASSSKDDDFWSQVGDFFSDEDTKKKPAQNSSSDFGKDFLPEYDDLIKNAKDSVNQLKGMADIEKTLKSLK